MAVSTVPAPVLEILHFEYRQLTSPPKNLENIRKWEKEKKFKDETGFEPMTTIPPLVVMGTSPSPSPSPLSQPSSPLLDAVFCQIYTSYHFNTNPLSPTVAETQTPRHQPITETLALSIDYNITSIKTIE